MAASNDGTNGIGGDHAATSLSTVGTAYEQCLRRAMAAILLDCGFQSSTGRCLRLLQAALEHFLQQVGQSARAYAEAAGRTQPVLGDATMALVDYGITVSSLIDFARQPRQQSQFRLRNIPAVFGHDWLSEAALKRSSNADRRIQQSQQQTDRPSHIPDHLPPYPRPHTFVSTPAFRLRHFHQRSSASRRRIKRQQRPNANNVASDDEDNFGNVNNATNSSLNDPADGEPDTEESEVFRRRAAEHRRQTELALTRFLAATGQTHSLFLGESAAANEKPPALDPFRLTANELNPRPFVPALMSAIAGVADEVQSAASPVKPRPNHPNPFLRPPKFPM